MTTLRWEPFTAMDELLTRYPSLLGRWPRTSGNAAAHLDWAPPVDVSETAHEYLIRATLPAIKKGHVEITVEDGMLTLSGERRQSEEQKEEKFHKVESLYGAFSRRFTLPDSIDADAITAESKDGVLTIHVPKTKAEANKPATIKVQ